MAVKSKNLRDTRIELFREVCKSHGVKVTPQRLEIFLEIMDAHDHPGADEIYNSVRERMPTVSFDTVYRSLATFEQLGLIGKVLLFEDRARFDPNTETHHHMVCAECKTITDFYWPEFDCADLPPGTEGWGRVRSKHIRIRGTCARCAGEE